MLLEAHILKGSNTESCLLVRFQCCVVWNLHLTVPCDGRRPMQHRSRLARVGEGRSYSALLRAKANGPCAFFGVPLYVSQLQCPELGANLTMDGGLRLS
jgi:hypothetical protein